MLLQDSFLKSITVVHQVHTHSYFLQEKNFRQELAAKQNVSVCQKFLKNRRRGFLMLVPRDTVRFLRGTISGMSTLLTRCRGLRPPAPSLPDVPGNPAALTPAPAGRPPLPIRASRRNEAVRPKAPATEAGDVAATPSVTGARETHSESNTSATLKHGLNETKNTSTKCIGDTSVQVERKNTPGHIIFHIYNYVLFI